MDGELATATQLCRGPGVGLKLGWAEGGTVNHGSDTCSVSSKTVIFVDTAVVRAAPKLNAVEQECARQNMRERSSDTSGHVRASEED